MNDMLRTPVRQKAKQISLLLKEEKPNYDYLREIFRHLRKELNVTIDKKEKEKRVIPSECDIKRFLDVLKNENNAKHKIIILTLLYTGVRVSEFINIKITDVNFETCQINIEKGFKGQKRNVLFPSAFKEILKQHAFNTQNNGGTYLFESSWKKPYTDRGIRKILSMYSEMAGMENSVSPNTLRTFFISWLKHQGIDNAMLQTYCGVGSHNSLARYQTEHAFEIEDVHEHYESAMQKLPF